MLKNKTIAKNKIQRSQGLPGRPFVFKSSCDRFFNKSLLFSSCLVYRITYMYYRIKYIHKYIIPAYCMHEHLCMYSLTSKWTRRKDFILLAFFKKFVCPKRSFRYSEQVLIFCIFHIFRIFPTNFPYFLKKIVF